MTILIRNGHLIEPSQGLSEPLDVLVDGGKVAQIGSGLEGDIVVDADGCIVCPGLVDMHVHFREPGFESKETIASGSRAAARGGFTSVVTMPNTSPPIDDAATLALVNGRAREGACIKVWPSACATRERAGEEACDMAALKAAGAVAVTDDGGDIADSDVLLRVLKQAGRLGLPYLAHCEDASLAQEGCMNEGAVSRRLGLPGIPKAAEENMIDRNIRLAEQAGAPIHIQHVSSAGGVDIIRGAKARGLAVTCETAPHYWSLTDEAIAEFGSNAKMNPPLREAADVAAVKEGLADGTIDCIATDHAPHTASEKAAEVVLAPFGIVGLETCLGLVLTDLVAPGVISLERAVALLSLAPARVVGLEAGVLAEGSPGDVTIFDAEATWDVEPEAFASRGRNTPFAGRRLRGQVRAALCGGHVVYEGQ